MQGKVGTIYNLDGPGYSDEYLLSHALEIDNMASHVKHYQWSFIGNLLNQMPGEMFHLYEQTIGFMKYMIWKIDRWRSVSKT